MEYILLVGALFNFLGGISILVTFAALPAPEKRSPADYAQYRLFTAGTAFTFAAMYYYLFQNPQFAMPFLIFGMCLKFWAFVVSVLSYSRYGLFTKDLIGFGVSNLVVGILFAVYLVS
jgi:hypothetical protein